MIHLYSEDEAHLNFRNSCAPVFVPIMQKAHVLNQIFCFVIEISNLQHFHAPKQDFLSLESI